MVRSLFERKWATMNTYTVMCERAIYVQKLTLCTGMFSHPPRRQRWRNVSAADGSSENLRRKHAWPLAPSVTMASLSPLRTMRLMGKHKSV